jgi:cytochrome c oxidase subunit 4
MYKVPSFKHETVPPVDPPETDHGDHDEHHIMPTYVYVIILAILMCLTIVTVAVSYLDMQKYTVMLALFIATIKVTLVMMYFMHLKYEKKNLIIMIVGVLITYGIFIGLTMADFAFRI